MEKNSSGRGRGRSSATGSSATETNAVLRKRPRRQLYWKRSSAWRPSRRRRVYDSSVAARGRQTRCRLSGATPLSRRDRGAARPLGMTNSTLRPSWGGCWRPIKREPTSRAYAEARTRLDDRRRGSPQRAMARLLEAFRRRSARRFAATRRLERPNRRSTRTRSWPCTGSTSAVAIRGRRRW